MLLRYSTLILAPDKLFNSMYNFLIIYSLETVGCILFCELKIADYMEHLFINLINVYFKKARDYVKYFSIKGKFDVV